MPDTEPGEGSRELRWTSIQKKCHPASFPLAQLWKDAIEALKRAGPSSGKEVLAEIEATVEKRSLEIHAQFSGPVPPPPNTFAAQIIFSEQALKSESSSQGIVESIYFERHKIPMKQDSVQMEAGDWGASRRVQRTFGDVEQLRCRKGPIRPFKGNLEHSNMFETLWGFGIELLTEEELADFFDKYCPCGIEAHDPDALKKQRTRFKRILQKAIALNHEKRG
jgi:hypothetical protein